MYGAAMFGISVSPCSNPDLSLEDVLAAYGQIGYRRFEVFTSWTKSAADIDADPETYRRALERHGFQASSLHLPPLTENLDASLPRAVRACRFAEALGCPVVIVKAETKADYIAGAPVLLDAIATIPVTPVLTNHKGSAITTLQDYAHVRAGIDNPQMKCLLEVGHFHAAGVRWPAAYEALAGAIALVHIKDQIGGQSVRFGSGEIDLPGLLERLMADGYGGDVVVEMEVADRHSTLRYLAEALDYVQRHTRGPR